MKEKRITRMLAVLLAFMMVFTGVGIGQLGPEEAWANTEIEWAGSMNYNAANNAVISAQLPESSSETEMKWATMVGHESFGAYYAGNTAIAGEYIYVTGEGKLKKLDKTTGIIVSETEGIGSNNSNQTDYLCIGGNTLYVSTKDSVEAYSLGDLRRQWTASGSFGQYHPIQYLTAGEKSYIWCSGIVLDASNGSLVKIYKDSEKTEELNGFFAWSSGAVVNNIFYVTDRNNIYAIDLSSGYIKDFEKYSETTKGNTSGQVVYDEASKRLYWASKSELKMFSVKVAEDGLFADETLLTVETVINSVNAPVIYDGSVYLVGQGGSKANAVAQVFDYDMETDSLNIRYTVNRTANKPLGTSTVSTVQCNPLMTVDENGVRRLYFSEFGSGIYIWEDTKTSSNSKLEQLADMPNISGVQYPNCYEQIAVDKEGNIYAYNEAGYLFCYGKSECDVPLITENLSTAEIKFNNGSEANALKVEASVSDGGTLSYQWQQSTDRKGWTNIEGAEANVFVPATETNGLTYYRCVITNNIGDKKASTASDITPVRIKNFNTEAELNVIASTSVSPAISNTVELTDAQNNGWFVAEYTDNNTLYSYLSVSADAIAEGSLYTSDGSEKKFTVISAKQYNEKSYTYRAYAGKFADPVVGKVSVTSEDGSNKREYCILITNADSSTYKFSSDASLNKKQAVIKNTGETLQLTLNAAENSSTIGTANGLTTTWKSSDESIATVDDSGKVTAIAEGTAIITAVNGFNKDTCTVTVGDVTAYVTLAKEGTIVTGKDEQLVAQRQITVTDIDNDGLLTVNDALIIAHNNFYESGADGGYASYSGAYGLSIGKMWGDESGCYGYWKNNMSCWSLEDTLSNGDYLTAFIYKDQTYWSDAYTCFDKNEYSGTIGEEITLTLNKAGYDESWNTVFSPCNSASIKVIGSNNSVIPYTTDKNGQVKLKFENAGTYKVMAYKEDGSIVPAVATVTVTGTVAPPTEQNAKVSFTLKGDTVHSGSLHSGTYYPTWIPSTIVELSDSIKTVGDVFKKVLDENGYKYVGLGAGYISSITTPSGLTLSEFDNGKDSGWMYTVNGLHPNVGLNDYILSDGDIIVWHYSDNYKEENDYAGPKEDQAVTTTGTAGSAITTTPTQVTVSGDTAKATVKTENTSEAIKQAKENKSAEIVIEVASADIKTAEKVQIEIPTAAAKEILNTTTADLTVKTPIGTVTVPRDALKELVAEAKGTTIVVEVAAVSKPTDIQKKAAGTNGHIITVTIKSGSTVISTFGGKSLKIKAEVPAKLKGKKVAAIHIAADGTIEQLAGKLIKEGTKEFYEFMTTHLSTFALVDADEIGLEAKDEEANVERIKELVSDMSLKARSSKTSKKNIKVTLTVNKDTSAAIKEIEDMGYTVKYKYYRSTRKASKYASKLTSKKTSYTNTAGKKGTKYYYKARVQVYDKDGKLVAQTALKQCRYAVRTWSK